FNNT
ncbi:sodium/alanine symporter, partial [Vibrio cholerae O1 str. NHCC-008D]